jgi:hypothetical protein
MTTTDTGLAGKLREAAATEQRKGVMQDYYHDEILIAAADQLDADAARIRELTEALEPFAEAGGQVPIGHGPDNEPTSDDDPVTMSVVGFLIGDVTVADFERARTALSTRTK